MARRSTTTPTTSTTSTTSTSATSTHTKHPYLSGNFAPVHAPCTPAPVTYVGTIPHELHGGMYVRNGGNPIANAHLGRDAHWFDGDGMLSGVYFPRSPATPLQPAATFVSQFVLTDVCLSAFEHPALRTPILPSISTLVNPLSRLVVITWRILRSLLLVLLSHLPGSTHAIARISVANTAIYYHDGRALATCESGPPIRVTLPDLDTVGWFDGNSVEGEEEQQKEQKREPGFGGTGPLSWMREWSTGHPKVDPVTNEMLLFHCNFTAPYVHYSLIPSLHCSQVNQSIKILNAPVPACSGGKMMHDFGVSRHYTVILDLPLSLTPFNLIKNKPVVAYEPEKPARFGVFPRRDPSQVRWFETRGCCIFHTANTWDEVDGDGNVKAVNLLACRLTSASLVFSAGNIAPPPHPAHGDSCESRPMSFFAKYDEDDPLKDLEKVSNAETTPLLYYHNNKTCMTNLHLGDSSPHPPISADEEQCRLYYYRFALSPTTSNMITHQFALSAIPFEFPTVSPHAEMTNARYIYGCSTSNESFGAALGKATKIDIIVRMDVTTLLAQAEQSTPDSVTGCVDTRNIHQICNSTNPNEPIKAFRLPPKHYAQEARFVPRSAHHAENDGYLLFYVFDESQLDEEGECPEDARSELWILDAKSMNRVLAKVHLPTRVPYGLHGNWFSEEQINRQRGVERLRQVPQIEEGSRSVWKQIKDRMITELG